VIADKEKAKTDRSERGELPATIEVQGVKKKSKLAQPIRHMVTCGWGTLDANAAIAGVA
jgi:hypothetical protein